MKVDVVMVKWVWKIYFIDQLAEGAGVILASPIYFGHWRKSSIDHAYPDEDIYKPYVELLENHPFKMNTELEFIESLIAPGVKFIGDVDEHEEYLEKAYEIGQKF